MIDEATNDSRSTTLVPGPHAPGQARQWVRYFAGYLTPETAQDLEVVVSELVTNAVMHAGLSDEDSIELAAEVRQNSLKVTVRANAKGIRAERLGRPPDTTTFGGPGMHLVRRLTSRVLIDADQGRVAFEVPLLVVG